MSSGAGARKITDRQATYTRQATILRKNLLEWDRMLHNPRGEDWPTMLGRLNAAFNQASSMDRSIEDVLEHFVYLPKKSTANPQDIPFFLSTRLEMPSDTAVASAAHDDDEVDVEETVEEPVSKKQKKATAAIDPVQELAKYESSAAQAAAEYEENMVRF